MSRIPFVLFLGLLTGVGIAFDAAGEDVLFEPNLRAFKEGTVFTSVVQPDGSAILGGSFDAFNGVSVQNLVRARPDGTIDPVMLAQPNGAVQSTAIANGMVFVGGSFSKIGDQSRIGLGAVLLANGQVSPWTLNTNTGAAVTSMLVDGPNLIVGGTFTALGNQPVSRLGRYNFTTGFDTVWQPSLGTSCAIPTSFLRKDNFVWVGCAGTSSSSPHNLVRVSNDAPGAIDTNAAPNPDGTVYALANFDAQSAFAGGDFKLFGGSSRPALAKFNTTTGALFPDFNPPITGGVVRSVLFQNSELFVGGSFLLPDGTTSGFVVLDPSTGALKAKADPPLNGTVYSTQYFPPDAFGVLGAFDGDGDFLRSGALYKRLPPLLRRYPIAPGVSSNAMVNAVFRFGDGSFVAGGDFTELNGTHVPHLAFFTPDLTLNRSVRTGLPFNVRRLCGDSTFTWFGGSSPNTFGRLHRATGAVEILDSSIGNVEALSCDPAQPFVYVATDQPSVFRFNTATKTRDMTWNPNPNGRVFGFLQRSDSVVMPFGAFTTIAGIARPGIAALSKADGSPIASFNANLALPSNPTGVQVNAAAIDGGTLFVGGVFAQASGQAAGNVASLNADTGQPTPGFSLQVTAAVRALATLGNDLFLAFPTAAGVGSGHTAFGLASVNKINGAFIRNWNALYLNAGALIASMAGYNEAPLAKDSAAALSDAAFAPTLVIAGQFDSIDGQPRTGLAAIGTPSVQTVTVYEFYNAALDHFFRTANAEEAAALTANPALGFAPTHNDFTAWHRAYHPSDAVAFDRFFGSVTPGPNSHFYTGSLSESNGLKSLQYVQPSDQPRWNFEETAFSTYLPDANGNCPTAAPVPVYRAFDNRALQGDSNHRFTTSVTEYNTTVGRGWIGEGKVACAIQ